MTKMLPIDENKKHHIDTAAEHLMCACLMNRNDEGLLIGSHPAPSVALKEIEDLVEKYRQEAMKPPCA